ncbi:hypothetical protein IB238_05675 [Rhizobium sp. ARZ01]|uniref:hypothetical protein n=1 Tax=Rhizobium sp. ARZ01 TaxID=2769313 RepID=UPI00177F2961|nr:hypothetical protein [Rhizobium sp. ARZ01]MBD9372119.1 hypothetical protein [Rhizobium sp. ARZ01]
MPGLETLALMISSLGTTVFAANTLYLGTYALAVGGLTFASRLLVQKPDVPKPEDGSYNLKQNVPSLAYVLGWTKKGGDYVFLEEKEGDTYHIIVQAAHRIDGYIQHYLHDEKITLGVDGVITAPGHFDNNVVIKERKGLNAETAYSEVVSAFPTIWTNSHRGDGLASVFMNVLGTSQKSFMKMFPNNMPELSSVIAGARLYDPRSGSTAFSRNLALMRFWHLTHPVGGKLAQSDMYLPEWQNAATVCDQNVTNRAGVTEKRYHGGFWFRANNDPVDVGRIMDQAAELVVYERPDGLVGVHAGEYVAPDITLTANDIVSVTLDANTRDTSNVLAVRGRYTRLDLDYNQSDAAIYGDPYVDGDDTERTKTIDNQAIQSHNHVQRLQKIAFTRANAPRVSIVAHYEPAENVPYRRFVRVNHPPKLPNVIVEITETPNLSLRDLTISFSGIIVPANLYAFNAATEEGIPGNDVVPLESGGVPMPTSFDVVIKTDTVSGMKVPYAYATWAHTSDKLNYELEWQLTDLSEPPRSVMSEDGDDSVRSASLNDGKAYQFRLRAWGGGTYSEWTTYVLRTAVADPTAPGVVTNVTKTGGAGQVTVGWRSPNSANYAGAQIYWNTANNFSTATLATTEYGSPNLNDSKVVTGISAGTRYGWVVAINRSGVQAAPVATGSFTVT